MNAVHCSPKTGNLNQQRLFGKGKTSPDISSSRRLRPGIIYIHSSTKMIYLPITQGLHKSLPFTRFQANVLTTECFLFHRKVRRAYHRSWDNRCKLFFCYSLGQNRKIKVSVYKTFYSDCQHLFSTVSEFFCGNSSASL